MAKFAGAFRRVKPFVKLVRGVWHELSEDNVVGQAAQMAFFFTMALFPFFILLAALVGILPSTGLWNHILRWVTLYLPESTQNFVFNMVAGLTHGRIKFLSIGVLSAAWAASGGVFTLMSSLNVAYEVPETRKLWKRAGLALLTLFVVCLLFLGSFGLLTGGHLLAAWISKHVTPGLALPAMWRFGHWLASLLLLIFGMAAIHCFLPNCKLRWLWVMPGALLVVAVWIPASMAFNFYVNHIGSYNRIYGTLSAFMILMVWIYIISLVVLVGAEVNREIIRMRTGGPIDCARKPHKVSPQSQKIADNHPHQSEAVKRKIGGS
jgi:membrane protein